MIGMNIRVLRKRNRLSQEQLAEKVDVSRQTVAKWENGEALPDIYKCKILSDVFQVTLDELSQSMSEEEANHLAPKGKQFFGVVKVGSGARLSFRNRHGICTESKRVINSSFWERTRRKGSPF